MQELKKWLIEHEGMSLKPYKCPNGKITIGVGRNLESNGLSLDECNYLLENDIARCRRELDVYWWFVILNENRKNALLNMCFNLGLTKLLTFKKMIVALEQKNYDRAAIEALDSRWAKQVKGRAVDIAEVIKEG
jgi:lysozyme